MSRRADPEATRAQARAPAAHARMKDAMESAPVQRHFRKVATASPRWRSAAPPGSRVCTSCTSRPPSTRAKSLTRLHQPARCSQHRDPLVKGLHDGALPFTLARRTRHRRCVGARRGDGARARTSGATVAALDSKQLPEAVLRLGKPKKFAQLACQVASNRHLNGEVIRLRGSMHMAPR